MGLIVTDQRWNDHFIGWLGERFGDWAPPPDTRTIAYVDTTAESYTPGDEILTCTVFSRWTPHTCEVSLATNGSKQSKASRTYIFTIFDYVFNHAGKSRFYTFVGVDNEKSIILQQMLGLNLEARLADHFGEGKDAFLFGITKRQWQQGKWSSPHK